MCFGLAGLGAHAFTEPHDHATSCLQSPLLFLGRPLTAAFSGLIARQYFESTDDLTPSLELCIRCLQLALSVLPARRVPLFPRPTRPVVVYTDASTDARAGSGFRLGIWVDSQVFVSSVDVPENVVAKWAPRRSYINLLELLAAPLLAFSCPHLLRNRDILWFIDNQAAWRSLVRSASSVADVSHLSLLAGLQFAKLCCHPWFEWVPTHQNISDPLSRGGWVDPVVISAVNSGTWTPLALSPPWHQLSPDLQCISAFISALGKL